MTRIRGIHAATVTPMGADGELDERQIRSQVAFLRRQTQVVGYLVNGHAGEIPYLSLDEQIANLRITRETNPDATIACGVCTDDPGVAIRNIAALARNGAHAVLVFPPYSLAGAGGRVSLNHYYRSVCTASALPVALYSPAYFSDQRIAVTDLVALAALPNVVAIKDGSWEVVTFEWIKEEIRAANLDIDVLGSSDEHFFHNYISGNVGCQASMVTILPEPICGLIDHLGAGAIDAARSIHRRLAPIARFIYRSGTGTDMVARLKLGLSIRGVIDTPHFRAPRGPVTDDEVATMSAMMAGLSEA
jgi:4-hydroxy-tetrahydrodipicolinate synthase